jgi:hypothetical protein
VGTEGLPYLVKQGKVENHVFLQSVGWNVCLDRRSNETRGFQWTKWGRSILKKHLSHSRRNLLEAELFQYFEATATTDAPRFLRLGPEPLNCRGKCFKVKIIHRDTGSLFGHLGDGTGTLEADGGDLQEARL